MFEAAEQWFARRGWSPFDFQREAWAAYLLGESGLLHAATGTGKTMAVWWGPLLAWLAEHPEPKSWRAPEGLRVLWVTPDARAGVGHGARAARGGGRSRHPVERRTPDGRHGQLGQGAAAQAGAGRAR